MVWLSGRGLARPITFTITLTIALTITFTLALRLWLGAQLPITGDEAYFINWGWYPDWGYYDHPPMVGWWLAALSSVSNHPLMLRLPNIVQPALLALAIGWAAPRLWPISPARRDALVLLVLLAPANVWNVLITPDTPLVYFCVLSSLAWLRAAQERTGDDLRWYLLAGVLLAGAVLSKYFVALLGLAYLVDALKRRTPRALIGVTLAYLCCLPALALMAWWNSQNCWPNYLFNFVNRHGDVGLNAHTVPLYALSLLYLLTPFAVFLAWRTRASRPNRRHTSADLAKFDAQALPTSALNTQTLATLFVVPLGFFALLSIIKTVGLHWMLAFVPLALLWLGLLVSDAQLRQLLRGVALIASLHVPVIVLLLSLNLPLESWRSLHIYPSAVLTTQPERFAQIIDATLRETGQDWQPAMDGYSNAATLGHYLRRPVIVFGTGASHARHDDIATDFRALAGRNILILRKSAPKADEYTAFFNTVTTSTFDVHGARFWQIRGQGFNYPAYREHVLRYVTERYYQIPAWLPNCGCYMCSRYFPGEPCPR
jgi:4-amino-4-deoxy-L-arabinose transferase-like glycosyltransferase